MRTSKPVHKILFESGITCLAFGNKYNHMLVGTKKGLFSCIDGQYKLIQRTDAIMPECIDYNTVNSGFAIGCGDGSLFFVQ